MPQLPTFPSPTTPRLPTATTTGYDTQPSQLVTRSSDLPLVARWPDRPGRRPREMFPVLLAVLFAALAMTALGVMLLQVDDRDGVDRTASSTPRSIAAAPAAATVAPAAASTMPADTTTSSAPPAPPTAATAGAPVAPAAAIDDDSPPDGFTHGGDHIGTDHVDSPPRPPRHHVSPS